MHGPPNKLFELVLSTMAYRVWTAWVSLECGFSVCDQPVRYPQNHFATVNGLKLHYQQAGTGSALVYLHAFTRSCSDWQDFGGLSRHFCVISIDLPSHGESEAMDTTMVYFHNKAAAYILAVWEQLQLKSVYLRGRSSGAMIGLYLSTVNPQLIVRQVLISGQIYFSDQTRKFIAAQGPESAQKDRLALMAQIHGSSRGRLLLDQFYHFRQFYGDPIFTPDLLAVVQANTLIIHGDNDPIAPVSNAWKCSGQYRELTFGSLRAEGMSRMFLARTPRISISGC